MVNSVLDGIEKSPIVKLLVALVFLVTAAAVLIDLNDRSTQLEIAAWDLFEKTEPGTPQRTRAANLLADTGANLAQMNFGFEIPLKIYVKETKQKIAQELHLNHEPADEIRVKARRELCESITKQMIGVDFSQKLFWSTLPPRLSTQNVDLSNASFACLDITGTFESAQMRRTNFSYADLTETNFSKGEMTGASFEFAVINTADFSRTNLEYASFDGAYLFGKPEGHFTGPQFGTSFRNANLENVSFRNTTFGAADFQNARMVAVNLSGAVFEIYSDIHGLTQEQLDSSWAWEGMLPQGLEYFDPPLHVGLVCEQPSGGAESRRNSLVREGRCRQYDKSLAK